tara:strand:+ start:62 stop:415 length:354 start_codon:yes stop_codon:yes gene_type:complete
MNDDKRRIGDNQHPIQQLSHKAYHSLKDLIADKIDFSLELLAETLNEAENGKRLFDRNKAIVNAQEAIQNLRAEIKPIKNCFKRQNRDEWQQNIAELSNLAESVGHYETELKERSDD